jgi:hypothetical protein
MSHKHFAHIFSYHSTEYLKLCSKWVSTSNEWVSERSYPTIPVISEKCYTIPDLKKDYIRNEWFSVEFYSTLLITSIECAAVRE